MSHKRAVWQLMAAVGAACSAVAMADVMIAYNNFGPGNGGFEYLTGTSWPIGGMLAPAQRTQSFTVTVGGPLSDVYLGIFSVLSARNVRVRVANNINNQGPTPADVLEEWVISSLPGSGGAPVTHLVSQAQPLLEAGRSYWLWITVGSGTAGWGFTPYTSLSEAYRTRSSDSSAWSSLAYDTPGALRVDVVPEPHALGLLLFGLAALLRRT